MGTGIATALTVAALIGLTVLLWRTVRRDGSGSRPAPRSRRDWAEGTSVELDRSMSVRGW